MLQVKDLCRYYTSPQGDKLSILEHINFEVKAGEMFSIVGPSGSGKTTLLGLCAGLDRASSGSVIINGVNIDHLDEDQRAAIRNQHVGFVFQSFQLIPTLTALENVMTPLELRGDNSASEVSKRLLERVGLADRMHHYPSQLSGGEQQRVAIARAFSNSPKILFADEPTGNLDTENGEKIAQLLFEINREQGTTLILVTHDLEFARKTGRVLRLKGGREVAN